MSLRANLSYENKFDLHENEPLGGTHFHMEWFHTKTCFNGNCWFRPMASSPPLSSPPN